MRTRDGWSLEIARAVLGLTALGGAIGVVGAILQLTRRSVEVTVDISQPGRPVAAGDVSVVADRGTLRIDPATIGERTLAALPDLLLALTVLAVATLLYHVAARARDGEPFSPHNASALWRAATITLIGGGLWMVAASWSQALLTGRVPEQLNVVTGASISLVPLAVAAVLFALAVVFRHGVRLHEEAEGVI